MRFQIEPTDRSEHDWISGCDTRLCEFDRIFRERQDQRVIRQALQSPSLGHELRHITSSDPIARVSSAIDHAFNAESLTTPAVSRVFSLLFYQTRAHFSVAARSASFSAAAVSLCHPNLFSPFYRHQLSVARQTSLRSPSSRGRDTSCLAPPAQIRTGRFPACGSYRRYLASKRR